MKTTEQSDHNEILKRSEMHWMTETGKFFQKVGPVWDALHMLRQRLADAKINYVVIGGLALNAHGYRRQTIDIDIVLRNEDYDRFVEAFDGREYQRTAGAPRRFFDPTTEVNIDILIAGKLAGSKRNQVVRFPDPKDAEFLNDLQTISLNALIELKLVTWRFKDWGDVVELIRINGLDESFAEQLDPTTRIAYLQCFDQKLEEDRYEREA